MEVLSIKTDPVVIDDPFGQVSGGKLQLRGCLFRLSYSPPILKRDGSQTSSLPNFDDVETAIFDERRPDILEEVSFFLPLAVSPLPSDYPKGRMIRGLVVQRTPEFQKFGTYRRVGCAKMTEAGREEFGGFWSCENWTDRPWPESQRQTIVII